MAKSKTGTTETTTQLTDGAMAIDSGEELTLASSVSRERGEDGVMNSATFPIRISNTDTTPGVTAPATRTPGQTILSDTVLQTIAGVAAREVEGVFMLGHGGLSRVLGRVTGTAETTQGVVAEVGRKEVAVDLEMVVRYGYNIRDVAAQVRALVTARIEQMTGLNVKEINIHVVDIHYETKQPDIKRRVE